MFVGKLCLTITYMKSSQLTTEKHKKKKLGNVFYAAVEQKRQCIAV